MVSKKLLLFGIIAAICHATNAQQQVFDRDKLLLEPFEYNEVKLQAGPLKKQFDEVESYYLAIPNDDILKGFRVRAGLPTNWIKLKLIWKNGDKVEMFFQSLK